MELITFSNFEKIATTFTAKDICKKNYIHYFDLDEIIEAFPGSTQYGTRLENIWIALITKNKKIIGLCNSMHEDKYYDKITADEYEGIVTSTWSEIYESFEPSLFLSSDTPVLNILTMFENVNDFYLILDENEIIGALNYYDLDCNEIKLSIFSLIMELDNLLNKIISNSEGELENILSKHRVKEIKSLMEKDHLYSKFKNLINYLNIKDKFDFLETTKIFNFDNIDRILFLKTLKTVRNKIVHAETIIKNEFIEPSDDFLDVKGKKIPLISVINEDILPEPKVMKKFIFDLLKILNVARNYVYNLDNNK